MKIKTLSFGFTDFDKVCEIAKAKSLQYKNVAWFVKTHTGNGGLYAVGNFDDDDVALREYYNGKDITYLKKQVKNYRPA